MFCALNKKRQSILPCLPAFVKILSVSETAHGLQRDVLPLPHNQSKTKWDPRGGKRTVLKKAAEGVWRASADRELNKRRSVSQRRGQGSDPTVCTGRTLWAGMRSPKSSMEEQVPPRPYHLPLRQPKEPCLQVTVQLLYFISYQKKHKFSMTVRFFKKSLRLSRGCLDFQNLFFFSP